MFLSQIVVVETAEQASKRRVTTPNDLLGIFKLQCRIDSINNVFFNI